MQILALVKIKRHIRCGLGKIFGVKTGKIEREIGRAEIISFDIFDTLVKRKVKNPEDIHRLVYRKFLKQTGTNICRYQEKRVNAEREAGKSKGTGEITLKDIFRCIDGISENNKKILLKLEEKTEISVCYPSLRMKEVYEGALKRGKRIVITSDMYLDEKIIKQILYRCGYRNFEKLYLSSSYNMRKSTGYLYETIRKDYPVLEGRILHIGDNVKSDYIIPRIKGIHALLISGEKG